jgi:hypothetical protein
MVVVSQPLAPTRHAVAAYPQFGTTNFVMASRGRTRHARDAGWNEAIIAPINRFGPSVTELRLNQMPVTDISRAPSVGFNLGIKGP